MPARYRSKRSMRSRKNRRYRKSVRRYKDSKIYSFKRTCQCLSYDATATQRVSNEITDHTNLASGFYKFALNDVGGYTDFTNLFEKYKITGVKLKFIPTLGTNALAGGSNALRPIAIAVDRSVMSTTPTFVSLMEDADTKVRSGMKPFSVWISKPTAYTTIDGSSPAAMLTNSWLDTANATVHHFGVKYAFDGSQGTVTTAYKVFATLYIKCKGVQ